MSKSFVVLLLEDSEEDILLFRRAVNRLGRSVVVQPVRDGLAAQNYLLGMGAYADRILFPKPDLVFSDLQVPGLGGPGFLEWLRQHPRFKTLPCIFLSGSAKSGDVQKAYEQGITSFILKPVDFQDWVACLESVFKFWMEIAERPVVKGD